MGCRAGCRGPSLVKGKGVPEAHAGVSPADSDREADQDWS